MNINRYGVRRCLASIMVVASWYCGAQVPQVSSFVPDFGTNGQTITITGTNFSPTASSNIVAFGGVHATVVTASDTQLTVLVPSAATYAPISVTANGLVGYSAAPFRLTVPFGGGFDETSLVPQTSLAAALNPGGVIMGDFDGDGRLDLVVANYGSASISVYRNVSLDHGNPLFDPPVILPVGPNPYFINVGDIDGDGKPDIAIGSASSAMITLYRNACSPGIIKAESFGPRLDLPVSDVNASVSIADLNLDGKPDVIVPGGSSVMVFRNIGTPGSLTSKSFAPPVSFAVGSAPWRVAVGDLDGDGMPDMVSANDSSGTISVLRNTGIKGSDSISFAPQLSLSVGARPFCVTIGDLDLDGKADLVASTYESGNVSVFHNISTPGSLTAQSFGSRIDFSVGASVHTVVIADVNGDGRPDLLAVGQGLNALSVFLNNCATNNLSADSFNAPIQFPTDSNPISIAVGDLDGDGKPDVAVANNFSGTISIFKNIMGPLQPQVLSGPHGTSVLAGATVTLSVSVRGSQPLTCQWFFNATNSIDGATDTSLVLTNIQLSQAGRYSVAVSNSLGVASSADALVEVAPLAVTIQPVNQIALAGQSVSISASVAGVGPFSYQWLLNGTNILDATNAAISFSSVQSANSGIYSLVVTGAAGSATSQTSTLNVFNPPQITSQPISQSVKEGTDVTFTVGVSGDVPISYQWRFAGGVIAGATNASLVVSNVQVANSGNYSVLVINSVGSVLSSNATLAIQILPRIVLQPDSQSVIAGAQAVFSVKTGAVFPNVPSGALALWLKADSGVVADSAGRVSRWVDQSGHTNDAVQASSARQPLVVSSVQFSGKNVLQFDGSSDFLQGVGDVGLSGDYTSFLVYNSFQGATVAQVPVMIGAPSYNLARAHYMPGLEMCFGAWANDYHTGYFIPTNTVRIWTERLTNSNKSLDLFDTSVVSSNKISLATSLLRTPTPGYFIGGLSVSGYSFGGDIAEVIYFKGGLSENDRMAVEGYLKGKYFSGGALSGVTYQWQFNGANVDGATNASLTISNAQPSDAGTYTVVLSNAAGSVTSSNAVLTVNVPPSFTSQPQSQAVLAGKDLTLTASVAGTAPLSYQWLFNGAAIQSQTNLSLIIPNIQPPAAGNYQLSITSPFGSTLSSNATISVTAASIQVVSSSGIASGTVTVPIRLVTIGTENAAGFSLSFDPMILTPITVALGSGAQNATLLTNSFSVANGKLGVSVGLATETAFPAGTQEIARVTFAIAPLSLSQVTSIGLIGDPIPLAVVDAFATNQSFTIITGIVSVTQADYEGNVTYKPDDSHGVMATDWVKVGRFVAGLDTPSPSDFQHADCAPRDTLGDGKLTVTDWVQTGRYYAGLDPLTPLGGPSAPLVSLRQGVPHVAGPARTLSIRSLPRVGATNSFYVEIGALGYENAAAFSLTFDPTVMRYVGTGSGSIQGAAVNVNAKSAATGQLAFTISAAPGLSFAVGTQQLIRIDFVALSYFPSNVKLAFVNTPVPIGLSDLTAADMAIAPVDGVLTGFGLPLPSLKVDNQKTNMLISWPSSASVFTLEASGDLHTNFVSVGQTPVIDGDSAKVTVPTPPKAQFFRLKLQK